MKNIDKSLGEESRDIDLEDISKWRYRRAKSHSMSPGVWQHLGSREQQEELGKAKNDGTREEEGES